MTAAPKHLTKAQKTIWAEYTEDFNLEEAEAQELLETAVVHLDFAKACTATVNTDGLTITINDGKTRTAHPLLKIERDSRNLALKCLKELRSKYPAQSEKREAKKSPRQAAKESNGDES